MLALPNLGFTLNWLLQMVFIMAASYAFYLVVEFPGHIAARVAGRALSHRRGSSNQLPLSAPTTKQTSEAS
jgi:hypothetical protein